MMTSTKLTKKIKLSSCSSLNNLDKYKMEKTEEILPFDIDFLTPAMLEEARVHLKETEETKTKALHDLRLLIKKEENLVVPMTEDFLLPFLRARKYNVKKAYKLFQNYWIFRRDHRSIFDSSDAEKVKELIYRNYIGFLPYRDRKGCVVMIFKVGNWDTEIDPYEEIFRAITGILIHSIQYPATQVCGYRVIFDVRGLSWTQLKMCTPSNVLLLIHSTQYCFPARYKGFHFLTENKLFSLAWAVIYPLLTQKLKKRIMMHGSDLSPLLDYIHPSVLPCEFGGKSGHFDNSIWDEIVEENLQVIMDQLNYGYKD